MEESNPDYTLDGAIERFFRNLEIHKELPSEGETFSRDTVSPMGNEGVLEYLDGKEGTISLEISEPKTNFHSENLARDFERQLKQIPEDGRLDLSYALNIGTDESDYGIVAGFVSQNFEDRQSKSEDYRTFELFCFPSDDEYRVEVVPGPL